MSVRINNDQPEKNGEADSRCFDGGVISSIKRQVKRADRFSVFVNEKFAIGISASVFMTAGLKKGASISAERLRELSAADELGTARSKALNFLSYRARTVREITDRLGRYGYSEEIRADVAKWLADQGYLNDVGFAEAFVDERANRKGYGPQRIAQDLFRKGVARDTADAALAAAREEADGSIAPVVLKKAGIRWARLAREEDMRKRKSKLVQYLQRRGFGYQTSVEILAQIISDSDD